jgi:hypothetical protein
MPYPYSFPTVSPGEEITAEKTNQMHQAHIDNNVPTSIDDYSIDINQMRLVEDPGNDGVESFPADLAGEIRRLRNEIKVIKSYIAQTAPSYWYSKLASANRSHLLRDGTLAMTGKLSAKGGAGGTNNPNNCGVVFDTDNDSGLFSVSNGVLGVYADGVEFFEASKPEDLLKVFKPILFPASQVVSNNPNALDDYEEGTWTPTLSRESSAPSITYQAQEGRYLKIGRLVFVDGHIHVSTVVSQGSGSALIDGLPFAIYSVSANTKRYLSPINIVSWPSYTQSITAAVTAMWTGAGSVYQLRIVSMAPGSQDVSVNFDNSMEISFTYIYLTNN